MLKTNSLESHIDIFKATDVNIKNVVFKYKTVLIFSIYFLALLKSEKICSIPVFYSSFSYRVTKLSDRNIGR